MKRGLYFRLAATGMSKNKKFYFPYIFTCFCMVMMYYIIQFLRISDDFRTMRGGESMQMILGMGTPVIAVFSWILLYYTNSFLIRRRQKEFGLYHILGMGKRELVKILIWENLMTAVISIAGGLLGGILFSKLAELAAVKIVGNHLGYKMTIEPKAIYYTVSLFLAIFAVILLRMLIFIFRTKPVDMLKSETAGEKPPKANWILAIAGLIILAGAYWIAVSIEEPMEAMLWFMVAVLMVIVATYLLFIAGSVAFCRLMQKKKNYYYKTRHFVSISSMVYRMKRNGAGLASICILSTMVLVTLSSTICLYIGEESILHMRYPRNIVLDTYSVDKKMTSLSYKAVNDALEKYGETPENILHYSYLDIAGEFVDDKVILEPEKVNNGMSPDVRQMFILAVSDYNRLMDKNVSLSDGEAVMYTTKSDYTFDTVTLDGFGTFKITERAEDFVSNGVDAMQMVPSVFLFVKDEAVVREIYDLRLEAYGENHSDMHDYYGFDLSCDKDKQIEIGNEIFYNIVKLKEENPDIWSGVSLDCLEKDRTDFYALYGGLFFLGILLGSVFIAAAVLIMYYKQISEGFEDKSKFGILQKVGMTKDEIRKSINSQVLTVFFAPLAAAGIHMIFAFGIIARLLTLFGLYNTGLLAVVTICCFLVFGLLYTAVYLITSGSYYKIVSSDI